MTDLTRQQQLLSPDEWDRLLSLDTESLRSEFASALSMTAAQLLRLAAIVRILEERGEDLSELKTGMIGYLRRIAYGQVLPEVVVRFSEYPSLVHRISNLPLSEQGRLARGEPVRLLVTGPDGPDYRMADPLSLSGAEVYQVFAKDHIRDESEQALIVQRRRQRDRPTSRSGRLRADRDRGVVLLNRTAFEPADILAALAQLQGDDSDPADRTSQVLIKLTEDEHQRLKERAVKGRSTITDLTRRALKAAGLI